jgi:hypothetical protein
MTGLDTWSTECSCGRKVQVSLPAPSTKEEVVMKLRELGWAINKCPDHSNIGVVNEEKQH